MAQDLSLKFKNKPSQETIYGWFPGGQEPPRHDPRDIYIKLGSRPPREQSYYETDILYQYHQSLTPSKRDYPAKQSASDAIKPPWSLHMQPIPNRADNEEELDKANINRSKSAPNHRIILKIPLANVSANLFDTQSEMFDERQQPTSLTSETSESLNIKEGTKTNATMQRPKTSFINTPFSPAPSVTPDRFMLSRPNFINSPSSFTDLKSNKLIEGASNGNQDKSSEKNESNTYSNLMSDLIDSKYLESLTTKVKLIPELNTNINDSLEATSTRLGLAKSAAATRRSLVHKVIEVKNIGKKPIIVDSSLDQQVNNLPIANKFRPSKSRPKTTNINSRQNDNNNNKSKKTMIRQRAGTAPISIDGRNKTPILTTYPTNNNQTKNESHYTLSDYHNELLMLSQDKKPITGTTTQLALAEKLSKPSPAPPVETEVLHTNLNSFDDVKLVEGHWKDQLLNRGSYLQKRPKYNVKLDSDKLKIDPPAPELHTNASETYFYNTLPYRKATFTINPHFISENLNVKKLDLQNRMGTAAMSSNAFGPVKFRRDYAFVY